MTTEWGQAGVKVIRNPGGNGATSGAGTGKKHRVWCSGQAEQAPGGEAELPSEEVIPKRQILKSPRSGRAGNTLVRNLGVKEDRLAGIRKWGHKRLPLTERQRKARVLKLVGNGNSSDLRSD